MTFAFVVLLSAFLLPTRVHERYVYYCIPFVTALAVDDAPGGRRSWYVAGRDGGDAVAPLRERDAGVVRAVGRGGARCAVGALRAGPTRCWRAVPTPGTDGGEAETGAAAPSPPAGGAEANS